MVILTAQSDAPQCERNAIAVVPLPPAALGAMHKTSLPKVTHCAEGPIPRLRMSGMVGSDRDITSAIARKKRKSAYAHGSVPQQLLAARGARRRRALRARRLRSTRCGGCGRGALGCTRALNGGVGDGCGGRRRRRRGWRSYVAASAEEITQEAHSPDPELVAGVDV